jgi:hypothetical protein
MRRVVAGFKSAGERDRRKAAHQETVETLEAAGVPTGGFGDSVYARMSPGLRGAIAEAAAEEAYKAAKAERERRHQAEQWQARSEEAARHIAIREALEAGEDASPRALRGEALGHTPAELIAIVAAQQDVEDQRFEAAELREFRRWKAERSADTSADVSAPTSLQLEQGSQTQARAATERRRRNDRLFTLQMAREQTFQMIKSAEGYKKRYGESW